MMQPIMDMDEQITSCTQALREGKIVLIATSAGWALAATALENHAVAALLAMTSQAARSLEILVTGETDILQYVAAPDLALFDWLLQQPHPVNVLYEQVIGLCNMALPETGNAVIRMESNPFCRALLKRCRFPLATFSAGRLFADIHPDMVTQIAWVPPYDEAVEAGFLPVTNIRWKNGEALML
jgi:L-threonylcarbamoyladenylate synthase